jgi:hypothetical protein
VSGEKQPALVPTGGVLRPNDVLQPGNRKLDTLDQKQAAFFPDGLEVEARHGERQVELEVIGFSRAGQCAPLDDLFRKPAIAGTIERLAAQPQVEPAGVTGIPGAHEVVGVERKTKSASSVMKTDCPPGA